VSYAGAIPQGVMAPHLPIPMPNVPGAPNYGFMSGNPFPAGAGPAPSGFGAQSGFMHSPRSFAMGNYYMTPYGHQVPYDSSAVGAQEHPLAPPGAASNEAILPIGQMQAAEAAARATSDAGQSAGNVNPGGVGSMPKGAGGYGGHRAAVGAGGTSGAAVPIVSNSSSPDGISSMHQAHIRGQHSGRRSSQSSGHGQQHSQQNGTMGTVNGLSYNQSGFEGSMPSAASRTGPSHGTKGIVSSTGISSHGMVSGASVELAPGKARMAVPLTSEMVHLVSIGVVRSKMAVSSSRPIVPDW
jgi:hypothetical protein